MSEAESGGKRVNGAGDGEAAGAGEEEEEGDAWMKRALHDLCQPLTALECLLYVNREPVAGESLDAGTLRSVMDSGLVECERMIALVRAMQERLSQRGKKAP